MAFRIRLTPEQKAKIAAERAFAEACFAANDIDLGRAILKLATDIRDGYPEEFSWERRGDGYSGALVWEIAPEIARRLGVADFRRGKRPYACAGDDDLTLRIFACNAIFGSRRTILKADGSREDPEAWSLLQREPCNGNPLAIGLDRVAPPTEDPNDGLARRIAEVSQTRGFPRQTAWSPAMDGTRRVVDAETQAGVAGELELRGTAYGL
jgi:hypothetical protein